jgi:ATP-binding cassette subfamily B protein
MEKLRLIRRFGAALLKLCPGKVAAYLICSFVSQTAIPLAIPLAVAKLTNDALVTGQNSAPHTQGIIPTYVYWLALTLLLVPTRMLFRLAQTNMDGQMETHLRRELFSKVIRQTPEFFHRYNPAQLTNILTQTTVEAQQAVRAILVDPFLQLASLGLATILIISSLKEIHDTRAWWIVVLMVLFGALSVSVVQLKGEKPVYQSQRDLQEQRFAISGLVDSAVKSPEEIQCMHAEPLLTERHSSALGVLMRLKKRFVLTMETVNSAIGLPTDVIQAGVLGLVVYQIYTNNVAILPGTLVKLVLLTSKLMEPFRSFAALGIVASSSWPAIEVVSKLLEEENRIKDRTDSRRIDVLDPVLRVEDVTFGYAPQLTQVFDHLTFTAPTEKITALVARMGQGKTTFFRLALRFYEPEKGQVLLGGFSATQFTLESLRQHVVMMSQFPAFFHDTVRDNFRIAKADAKDEEILSICKTTGLLPILQKAIGPDPLGMNFAAGAMLSGGQKRLFALTRCLLRNPTFLFLDEPTTNMSNDEKYQLIPMMKAACRGRTVIVVDHDIPWLLQFCDHFLVLEGGHIVQEGPGDQLLREPGLLKELYTLTFPVEEDFALKSGRAAAR